MALIDMAINFTSKALLLCEFAGVAVGAGWQLQVAFVNIGCYYLVGIPVGVLLGFKLKLGALVS